MLFVFYSYFIVHIVVSTCLFYGLQWYRYLCICTISLFSLKYCNLQSRSFSTIMYENLIASLPASSVLSFGAIHLTQSKLCFVFSIPILIPQFMYKSEVIPYLSVTFWLISLYRIHSYPIQVEIKKGDSSFLIAE